MASKKQDQVKDAQAEEPRKQASLAECNKQFFKSLNPKQSEEPKGDQEKA